MKLATLHHANGSWSRPFPDLDSERTLVLVFAAPAYATRPDVLIELAAAYPRAAMIGCSTAGEIDQTQIRDDSITVAVAQLEHTGVRQAEAQLDALADARAAAERIANELFTPDLRAVLVLLPGINGSELVAGLNARLPAHVIVTGGMAGDGAQMAQTWTVANGRIDAAKLVAVGLYGDRVRVSHGSGGGWDPFGVERIVTRATGNVLYALDDRPALALYRDYLGDQASGLPGAALRFPLSLRASADATDSVVRTAVGIDEAAQSVTFAADVPVGSYAKLMRANLDRLVLGAQAAGVAAAAPAEGPVLCIAISCVGRRLVLGARCEEETRATLDALPVGTAQVGFYSYGEIAPHASGEIGFHNQTMTLTVISEQT